MIRVFSYWFYWKTIVQVLVDLAIPVACVGLAVTLLGSGSDGEMQAALVHAAVFAVAMTMLNGWLGFYERTHGRTWAQSWVRACLSAAVAVPLAYVIFSLLSVSPVNRELLLAGFIAVLATLAHRMYDCHARTGNILAHRVLVFGAGIEAEAVAKALRESDRDIQIVGFYPSSTDQEFRIPAEQILSRTMSLSDTTRELRADEIIVAIGDRRGGVLPLRELLDCKVSGVRVLDLASYFERALGQIRLDSLRAGWLIFGDGFRQGWWRTVSKRCYDIVAASVLLLASMPVMLLTMILIALEDGAPIFYRQERVGLNGRLFKVVKFRSMRRDAERDGKPRWASANDDRVTRVGRVIRKVRIDELPQLFSVLIGDMSLVGPRPERPYFVDQLARDVPYYSTRHSVKPGVTGWAQVRYHYGCSVNDSAEKLQYDLYYVKNHSLFLDTLVLFETVGVVLSGKGAQ